MRGIGWVIPVSVVFGLLLGLLAGSSFHARRVRALHRGWNLIPVTAAARPLRAGTVIEPSMLVQRKLPEQWVTQSVLTERSAEAAVGKTLLVNLEEGEPVLSSDFASSWSSTACLAACNGEAPNHR